MGIICDWRVENSNNKKGDKAEGRAEINIFSLRILVRTREEAEERVNPSLVSLLSLNDRGAETHVRGFDCISFTCSLCTGEGV